MAEEIVNSSAAPAAAPALKGGMLPGESVVQAMQRIDPASEAVVATAAPARVAAPETKAKNSKEKKADAIAPTAPSELEAPIDEAAALAFVEKLQGDVPHKTLTALAKRLGLDVDGARVAAKERIEFREQKRKHAERMAREEQDLVARFSQAKGGLESELSKARAILKANEDGNFEALAKELGAKDWNDLQEKVIARLSDPNYKRMLELEAREAQRETNEKRAAEEFRARELQQQRAEAMQTHVQNLSEHMKASKDPLVAAMHDDPLFLNSVIEIQRQNWDGSTTVTPEQAIKIAARGFAAPLAQTMRTLYEKLTRVYGVAPAQAAEALAKPEVTAAVQELASGGDEAAPTKGKKNKTSAPAAATGNAPAPARKFASKKEADEYFTRELQKAIAADRS